MITEQEAIQCAWDLVRREQLHVRGVRSVEVGAAPEFLPEWAGRGDVWCVLFDLDVPPDCVQSPDIAEIVVDRMTGEAAAIEML